MSYDIYLDDPETGCALDTKADVRGGTYAMGGADTAWLNITYNYSKYFYRHIHPVSGIRWLYGKTAQATIPRLKIAIAMLDIQEDSNYWNATEGNARRALLGLLALALESPHGIWSGD